MTPYCAVFTSVVKTETNTECVYCIYVWSVMQSVLAGGGKVERTDWFMRYASCCSKTEANVDVLVQYWWYLSQAMAAMKWMLERAVTKPWKPCVWHPSEP